MIFDRWREKRNQKIEEKLEDQRRRIDMLVRQNESLLYGPKDNKLEKEVEE